MLQRPVADNVCLQAQGKGAEVVVMVSGDFN